MSAGGETIPCVCQTSSNKPTPMSTVQSALFITDTNNSKYGPSMKTAATAYTALVRPMIRTDLAGH